MSDERDASPATPAGDGAPTQVIAGWEPALRSRAVFDVVLIVIGLAYLGSAIQLGVGEITRPGPGAFPIVAGALLVVTLGIDLIRLLVTGRVRERGSGRVPLAVVTVLGSLLVYLVGVEIAGHAITASVVFAILLFALGTRAWWKILLISVGVGLATDLLFTVLLGLDLPTGLLGFGVDAWI